MPNVRPGESSPPVSGAVEENDLQRSDQEPPPTQSLPALIYSKTAADPDPHQTLLPPRTQRGGGGASTDAARECSAERNREVVKEIAISSTAFIGPACRPEPAIEKELSEFYKELEELDQRDSVDGHARDNEGVSQSVPAPAVSPTLRKDPRADLRSACRPYPAARPHRGCGNSGNWRPYSHQDSFNHQNLNRWQFPPPRRPHGPPAIQFYEPLHFFPLPPAETPVQPPNLQPPFNDCGPADGSGWSSRAGPCSSHVLRLSSPTCSGSLEQRRVEQNQHQRNRDVCLVLVLMRGAPGSGKSTLAR